MRTALIVIGTFSGLWLTLQLMQGPSLFALAGEILNFGAVFR